MKIFLSAVSAQFKECRDALASDLRAVGAEVVVQEDFQQQGRTLLEKLERYIAGCDRVIALIGDAYGFEPDPVATPGLPQRSYSQWEYRFAQGERLVTGQEPAIDTYVYFGSQAFLTSRPVAQESGAMLRQKNFVADVRQTGKDWSEFGSIDELRALVLRDGFRMSRADLPPVIPVGRRPVATGPASTDQAIADLKLITEIEAQAGKMSESAETARLCSEEAPIVRRVVEHLNTHFDRIDPIAILHYLAPLCDYDYKAPYTVQRCSRMRPIASAFFGAAPLYILDINFVRIASSMGGLSWMEADHSRAKSTLERARFALDELQKRGLASQSYAQELFRIDDYACEYELEELDNFISLCDDFPVAPEELFKWRLLARRCAACRMIRAKDFDSAEHWLEEAYRELFAGKAIPEMLRRRDDHFNNLGYLHFIQGSLHFRRFETGGKTVELLHKARLQLAEAIARFRRAGLKDHFPPLVLSHYMLYRIGCVLGLLSSEQRMQQRDLLIKLLAKVGNFCVMEPSEAIEKLLEEIPST
jgi:hypothetical protein